MNWELSEGSDDGKAATTTYKSTRTVEPLSAQVLLYFGWPPTTQDLPRQGSVVLRDVTATGKEEGGVQQDDDVDEDGLNCFEQEQVKLAGRRGEKTSTGEDR